MCRLLGLLGTPASRADPWLVGSDRSLLVQSHASEKTAQPDGWGIGWYDRSRSPHIEKGTGGAFEEAERPRFIDAAKAARGPVVLGHLRKASNPMGLPRSRLIAPENSQPFTHGSYLFIHNGEASLPRETRPRLGPLESAVRGVNDSEVLFYLFVRHLEAVGDPVAAFSRTRADLTAVWEEQQRRTKFPYTGLNVIFARGPNELWAFCHWLGEHGRGLFAQDQPYYQMGYQSDARTLLVGSEPFSSAEKHWRRLQNGEYLVGRVDHGLVGVETGKLP